MWPSFLFGALSGILAHAYTSLAWLVILCHFEVIYAIFSAVFFFSLFLESHEIWGCYNNVDVAAIIYAPNSGIHHKTKG